MSQIVKTNDKSHTVIHNIINEAYHSLNGAVTESIHIFIKNGFDKVENNKLNIIEYGFGTGLNALLTFLESEIYSKEISYTTIEKYPLPVDFISNLNYSDVLKVDFKIYKQFHDCEWNKTISISPKFKFTKIEADFLNFELVEKYDLVFFDAFAPDCQPELWSESIFANIYNSLNKGGILVTYSSKGIVKQNLRNAGFKVKRLPGPPGKRHILRATKE